MDEPNEQHKSIIEALKVAAPEWTFEQIDFVAGRRGKVVEDNFCDTWRALPKWVLPVSTTRAAAVQLGDVTTVSITLMKSVELVPMSRPTNTRTPMATKPSRQPSQVCQVRYTYISYGSSGFLRTSRRIRLEMRLFDGRWPRIAIPTRPPLAAPSSFAAPPVAICLCIVSLTPTRVRVVTPVQAVLGQVLLVVVVHAADAGAQVK